MFFYCTTRVGFFQLNMGDAIHDMVFTAGRSRFGSSFGLVLGEVEGDGFRYFEAVDGGAGDAAGVAGAFAAGV